MNSAGVDDAGNVYASPAELWEAVARNDTSASHAQGPAWYKAAVDYWDAQEASVNGVLGGYGFVSAIDVRDSRSFLLKAFGEVLHISNTGEVNSDTPPLVALDCGAGVGRVSETFLLHHFNEVDLVEPSAHLLEMAKKKLCGSGPKPFPSSHRAVGFFQTGLESFNPEPGRYDAVWVQWAMLYLTDDDTVAFLKKCAAALRPNGMIFIKENVCAKGFVVDTEDASVTRSHAYNIELFTAKAGLKLAHTALQRDFPKQLYKVRMYALKP